jgi:hypothetical protein
VVLSSDLVRLEADAARELASRNNLERLRDDYIKATDDRLEVTYLSSS